LSEKKLTGIDTNILVHMLDSADAQKHERALEILDEIHNHPERFVVSIQVYGELSSVIASKYPQLSDLRDNLIRFLFSRVGAVHYTINEILLAGAHRRFWDAVLAYTYIRAGADAIYTENVRDFKQFSDKIRIVNPFE